MPTVNQADSRREKERQRLLDLKRRQPESDSSGEPGVLLSDVIHHYVEWFDLIRPFDEKNLKPANYKLTVGDRYAINGEIKALADELGKNELVIPPFAVAIIQTRETISMPRFLIGRWNIQVRRAYEGLVWVGGPQVDAGYVGHLFCPIYNLSSNEVILRWGESIAVIDFVKTTSFHKGKSFEYPDLPEKILFEDYKPQQLISGIVKNVQARIEDFAHQIKQLQTTIVATQNRIDNFVILTFGAVSVLFAAITIFVARTETNSWWSPSLFLISVLAIFLSMSAWLKVRTSDWKFARIIQLIAIASLLLAIGFHIYWGHVEQLEINDLRRQIKELQVATQNPPTPPATAPQAPRGQTTPPAGAIRRTP
jgi:deoxycytidine triphosphate deaminase